jgi:glycosyltransferase involved in cell wall biosynthesis
LKNIWIINHYAIPPEFGGLNRHYYFSKYLAGKGHHVKIFTAGKIHNSSVNIFDETNENFRTKNRSIEHKYIKELDFGGVEYTFLKTSDYRGNGFSRIKNMLEFPYRVVRLCPKFGSPDLIYTSSPSPFAALAAVRLAKKLKTPIILEIRDLWPESIVAYKATSPKHPVIRILYKLEKYLYKNANAIIFTAEGGKDYIKEKNWQNEIELSKIYNINNGVDLEEYRKSSRFFLEDPDLDDEGTFKVVYTGSIREVNHLIDLVDAAEILEKKAKKAKKKIKFLVYGEGTERSKLEEISKERGLSNIVFKGHVARKFIPYILSKSDLNIIIVQQTDLMRFGSSLNKLFDYMASGKPIVSNLKVNYDLLERYDCGITTKTRESEDLATAIEKIYNLEQEDYQKMCQNAKKAAKDYDYQLLANKLDDIIHTVLCKNK